MIKVKKLSETDQRPPLFYQRKGKKQFIMLLVISIIGLFYGCEKDQLFLIKNEINCATPYSLKLPNFFPPMSIPSDNPFTVEGIELGRHLFYEKMLSGNNSQSCASCHQQSVAFADTNRFSVGIDGFTGSRTSMPIANLAYSPKLFWDGKATSLEQQVLFPIQSQVEMHEDLFKAVKELQQSDKYPHLFYLAFCDSTVTVDRMSKAMAQFMRTMLSYSFKMAPGSVGTQSRNAVEERGYQVFIDENKGDCFHCHSVNIFATNFEFANNGLLTEDAPDLGLMGQNGNPNDKHKFKTPSLINLKYTAPYMHDGRFENLRQVIDFYDTSFHVTSTLDVNLLKHTINGKPKPRNWTEQEKNELLAFLLSLRDDKFLTDPKFSEP